MAGIYIENRPYTVKDGDNLLHACLDLGFDIPYFCWHPALHSVGSCRLCAVKQFRDEKDTRGRIVMSCMTPVREGMSISIDDDEVKKFRAGIIEMLMLNHPHDCPVCDEGGECHLQDMTVMTGHVYRKYRHKKRTYRNQNLGPFLNHEMNRCIHCYRCVRFYRDFAGGRDLEAFASHHFVYFGRYDEGVLENVFSGNLAEVCPTGVFTDKTYKRNYTRKWDLQTAPSVCVHCGLGCNTIPGERGGTLRRILNRYNGEVNGYFLCDRGRFGYGFVNHERRIRRPVLKQSTPFSPDSGLGKPANNIVPDSIVHLLHFGAKVIGIGSPRASLEANYALRTLVGPEQFYSGMSESDAALVGAAIRILRTGPARSPSIREAAMSDAVLILGEDVINTAPLLGLAVRQSVRNKPMELSKKMGIHYWNDASVRLLQHDDKGPLYIATPERTGLDDIAERTYRSAPDDIARLAFAVAHAVEPGAPSVPDISTDLHSLAQIIAGALKDAKRPLIVSGTGCRSISLIHAAANIAWALCATGKDASLCFTMPECNSLGLGLIGGGDIEEAFRKAREGGIETIIILENDLYRRADAERVSAFLDSIPNVIVIDSVTTKTAGRAIAVLPSGTFAESGGTLVSSEGRAQRFFRVFIPDEAIHESWRWLCAMSAASERPEAEKWKTSQDIIGTLAEEMDVFAPAANAAPAPGFRIGGQRIPRQPHRYSGRTALIAHETIHEPAPPDDPDSPLSFSMEGYNGKPPAPLIARYWFPAWNSVQALNKFQSEVGVSLPGGGPGQRLIEPSKDKKISYFKAIPEAFKPHKNEWLFIPLYHLFGSEELSVHAPGIAELSPEPYLALNAKDAARLGIEEGDRADVSIHHRAFSLPVRISRSLAHGVAGLPSGLPSMEWILLPAHGTVSASEVRQ